jgi:TetR/AcrR family transcriptional regulator
MTQVNALSKGALRIVDIATQLFAAKGFSGVSIHDIAASSGGSKANVFHHFQSKEALYLAVMGSACSKFRDELKGLTDEPSGSNCKLSFIAQQHLQQMLLSPDSTRLILREVFAGESGINRSLVAEILHQNFDLIIDLVKKEQDNGRIASGLNPAMIAVNIISLNTFFFQSWTILEQFEEFRPLGSAQRAANVAFDTIAEGLLIK